MGLFRSRAGKKLVRAETKLAEAQTRRVAQQTAGTWEQITSAIEAGEASMGDLPRLQMAAMPARYLVRCWAAELPHSTAHRA